MARVRSVDTQPELSFRRAVWRLGFRFRIHDPRLPGRPDLVFPRQRLAVFIDGDFWHGHQWRTRRLAQVDEQFQTATNAAYWRAKIRRNIERDFRTTHEILGRGWSVLRLWATDVAKNLEGCVSMTVAALENRKTSSSSAVLASRQVGEFFAGIGLVRLAFESRGWPVVYANDFDEQKAAMYRANFGATDLSTEDIHSVASNGLPECAIYTASFPCNDLSIAGAMKGLNGTRSGAFWGFVRILRELGEKAPPLVLLENVVGFLMSHDGRDFETAMTALNEVGYCCDAFILNASSFTPQSRPRLFIVAKRTRLNDPSGIVPPCAVRPPVLSNYITCHPNIEWDIRRLPAPPCCSQTLADIVEELPASDPAWWNEDRAAYFFGQLSERHTAAAERMIAGPRYTYATAFRRVRNGRSMAELRTDGIAGCLRTPRGGSGRQILFKAGRGKFSVRLMTARECARLQGTPDSYKITAPLNQALFGFGDAVCVPAIEWIIDNYLNPALTEMLRGRVLKHQA
ncbi:MAG: DNA mismatch endonuclease Vsr [Pirellulales bacterium]|nr:DNA mismatch endonuclease Vsr [Pirellulales bacterium]